MKGVCKLNFDDWVYSTKTKEVIKHFKFYFFDQKYLSIPEFVFPNQYLTFKENDRILLEEY